MPEELTGGNVRLVTTMDKWEEETSLAYKDGKIVKSFLLSINIIRIFDIDIPFSRKQVVVNFSASWCTPCRQIAPAYRDVADKYPGMLFLTVDVDQLAVSSFRYN